MHTAAARAQTLLRRDDLLAQFRGRVPRPARSIGQGGTPSILESVIR